MKLQTRKLGWLIASAIALASASAFGGDIGKVSDSGRSANEGFGRSATIPAGGGQTVRSADGNPGVLKVVGRASQMPSGDRTAKISTTAPGQLSQLGRGSGPQFGNAMNSLHSDVSAALSKQPTQE